MKAGIDEILEGLAPAETLSAVAGVLKKILPLVSEEDRLDFVVGLIGGAGDDKVASMVHLWLAECLDEGVDPTHMCQRLVDRVAQSRQLMAVADPELLVLFEDWLDELETEVISLFKKQGNLAPGDLAHTLGLSHRGATFVLSKLAREGKLSWYREALAKITQYQNLSFWAKRRILYFEGLEILHFVQDDKKQLLQEPHRVSGLSYKILPASGPFLPPPWWGRIGLGVKKS